MQLVYIPAGKFTMGSPADEPGRQADEGPTHLVVLTKPFYIGMHEVTVGQYRTFVKEADYKNDGSWENPGFPQTDKHAVVNVSWIDAMAFCDWLGKKEREKYSLPTEAQWEYCCRAGTTTTWPFGDERLGDYIWYGPNSGNGTNPVGLRRPNAWGIHDMLGNAAEWTLDWYEKDYYRNSPREDPTGAPRTGAYAARGGCWYHNNIKDCRPAYRGGSWAPQSRNKGIGFRVVRLSFGGVVP
jgi:formylglycine-generating enzyme required for sulfatase activity